MNEQIFISTDKNLLNINLIHEYLAQSYWARNIPLHIVKKSVENSLCFGVYKEKSQVGFARAITDYAVFAYLADVFIVPEEQGKGYGKELINFIMNYPDLQGLRRWHLVTFDAQKFYIQFGFSNPENPERHMEIRKLNIYGE